MTTGIALAVYALSLLAGAIAVWRRPVAAVYLWIVGVAVHNAVGAAYSVGGSRVVRREEFVRLAWTIVGAAVVVAALGLIDVYAISISWWRNSAAVPYFNKPLGYDYHGTGNLPENFIYNVGGDKP